MPEIFQAPKLENLADNSRYFGGYLIGWQSTT